MQHTDSASPELQLPAADTTIHTRPPKGLWRETLERLIRKPSAVVGLIILGTLVLIAIFAPVIATHDPLAVLLDVPEEGAVKRMDPCIHLLGCPSAGDELVHTSTETNIQAARLNSTNSLMSAADGKTITVWKTDDGSVLFSLQHESPVTSFDWSPNDQTILAASGEELIVWDINRRIISRTLPHEGGVDLVEWNADGTRFLTASGRTVRIYDTLSWTPVGTIELENDRLAAAWNNNGTVVMTASGNRVQLWNAFVGTEVASLDHDAPLTSAVFNGSTNRILTTSGNTLHVWNTASYVEEIVIEHDRDLTHGAWSENLSRGVENVMAISGNTGFVWKSKTGELLMTLDHGDPIQRISSSPLATRLITQSDTHITVWDANNGDSISSIELEAPITNVAWQNNGGGLLVTSGRDLRIIKTSNYQYIMGVDGNVRDQFSRVIYGTRVSLMVGLTTVSFAVIIGIIAGAVAGFLGGWVDNLIMRIMDVVLAFPPLILAIAVVTVLGPGLQNALLAISIVFIPAYARVARAGVLSVKEEDFVTADRALGVHPARILFRRVLPNALAPLIVQATLGIGTAILDAAALSFLGLGAQPPMPEWGSMLGAERNQIFTAPHLVFYPGIAIMIIVLAFNLLGDGLRDALDPRLDR
ncbi:MAG: ABC transporter permease subunit [Anaerolineae bacterium]|nr:ABC transporter permease subunit [Anaerolineae bacterium]